MQPTAGKGSGANMPVYAMPAPPTAVIPPPTGAANPNNPFYANSANENTSLNTSGNATYTPGIIL